MLKVSENEVLNSLFRSRRGEVAKDLWKLYKKNLQNLYISYSDVWVK
jgi:hypothetical protein